MDGGENSKNSLVNNYMRGRRDSVIVAGDDFQRLLIERLGQLRSIWDELGMTEDGRRERMQTALNHLRSLLVEMVEEETEMRDSMRQSLDSAKIEIDILIKELRVARPDFLVDGVLSLIDMTRRLDDFKDELMAERTSRIEERDRLLNEHRTYKERLGLPEGDEIDQHSVPDRETLQNLKTDVERMKGEWEHNLTTFDEKQTTILNLAKKFSLEGYDVSEFQRLVLDGGFKNDKRKLVLSRQAMFEMVDLENVLRVRYDAYLVGVHERVDGLKSELAKWWDQCHVPAAERERFSVVAPEIDFEHALGQYNQAISYWREFYESRKAILDKIGEWERLWQEFVVLEERERDPNRYKNRGGALLDEEKRRKKVVAMLSQVKKQLGTMTADYDSGHPNTPFLMDGVSVINYIESIEEEYREKKQREKDEKDSLKKQQLMVERMYGASSAPNSQRKRVGCEKAVTPSKLAAATSKVYVHSSLSMARSPIAGACKSGPGSSSKLPPTGLPSRAQTVKRKILADHHQESDTPFGDHGGHSAASSTHSYGEFVNVLRNRGTETHSSFIANANGESPSKTPRVD